MSSNSSPIIWVCTNRELNLCDYPYASRIAIGDVACRRMLTKVAGLFSWRKIHFNPYRDPPFRLVVDEDIDISNLINEFVFTGGRLKMYLTVRDSTEE